MDYILCKNLYPIVLNKCFLHIKICNECRLCEECNPNPMCSGYDCWEPCVGCDEDSYRCKICGKCMNHMDEFCGECYQCIDCKDGSCFACGIETLGILASCNDDIEMTTQEVGIADVAKILLKMSSDKGITDESLMLPKSNGVEPSTL